MTLVLKFRVGVWRMGAGLRFWVGSLALRWCGGDGKPLCPGERGLEIVTRPF